MKVYLKLISILLISVLVKSEDTGGNLSNEDQQLFNRFSKLENDYFNNCTNRVEQWFTEATAKQPKCDDLSEKLTAQKNTISNLTNHQEILQLKVEHFEIINRTNFEQIKQQSDLISSLQNDKMKNSYFLDNYKGITDADADKIIQRYINTYADEINKRDEKIEKLQSEALQLKKQLEDQISELKSQIKINATNAENEMKIVKDKLISCETKSEMSLGSSCIGKSTDVHKIKVPGMEAFSVLCDSSLVSPGWTVIYRRKDGSDDFNRNWDTYNDGFGNLKGEFFIGLKKLRLLLSSQPHELYIYIEKSDGNFEYERYSNFSIGTEEESYEIKSLGQYNTSFQYTYYIKLHKQMKFYTPDRDNQCNHASSSKSGWWFNQREVYCYLSSSSSAFSYDYYTKANYYNYTPFRLVQIMIKPIDEM